MYLTIRRGHQPAAHAAVWNESGEVRVTDEFGRVEPHEAWKAGTRIHIQPDGPNTEVFDRHIEYDSTGQLLPIDLPQRLPNAHPRPSKRGLLQGPRRLLREYWVHLGIALLFVIGVAVGTYVYHNWHNWK